MGIAGTALAVTAWGASSVVAKIIDMGALALITYRFLLFAIVMAVYLVARRIPVTRADMRHSLWGGITLGIDAGLFFTAVKLTTVANATIVNALQVVLVSVVSARLYGERMNRRDIGYAALAMVGVAVVALGSSGSENWSLAGDLAAVGALFGWSAYFIVTPTGADQGGDAAVHRVRGHLRRADQPAAGGAVRPGPVLADGRELVLAGGHGVRLGYSGPRWP